MRLAFLTNQRSSVTSAWIIYFTANIFVLSVFQATLTSSEDDSTGSSILLTWTRWRATPATSAWTFSAVETCDSLTVENHINSFVLFYSEQWREAFGTKLFTMWIQGDETVSFKSVYALLHLLSLRSVTPFPQETQVIFSQTWYLCSYAHIYFALFCHRAAEIWALCWWCVIHVNYTVLTSIVWAWFTDRTSTDCLILCGGCFSFLLCCFFPLWMDKLILRCLKSFIKLKRRRKQIYTLAYSCNNTVRCQTKMWGQTYGQASCQPDTRWSWICCVVSIRFEQILT